MRKYKIRKQTLIKAKDLGVEVVPSTKKNKKIDVLRSSDEIVSIGDSRYEDYHTYLEKEGQEVANDKRSAFRKRHDCSNKKKGTAGYYVCSLLW